MPYAGLLQPTIQCIIEKTVFYLMNFHDNSIEKIETLFREVIKSSEQIIHLFPINVQKGIQIIDQDFIESIRMIKAGVVPTTAYKNLGDLLTLLRVRNCVWLGQPRTC
jgi:hypothetical protein